MHNVQYSTQYIMRKRQHNTRYNEIHNIIEYNTIQYYITNYNIIHNSQFTIHVPIHMRIRIHIRIHNTKNEQTTTLQNTTQHKILA